MKNLKETRKKVLAPRGGGVLGPDWDQRPEGTPPPLGKDLGPGASEQGYLWLLVVITGW